MARAAPTRESEARDRIDTVVDYLDTLLRALWENLDVAGVTSFDLASEKGVACQDALRTLSVAQELVSELTLLGDRPWTGKANR